ncbi:carbamoyl-phosphate synthase (glutamine-hydrolyzing) large subunit [Heyndrickxia acidicola]|uniref:Carbamoyl phosphate synthase large chain n=1 Tax=Heyndrickxia acidicola TaxID=209389 RepID=A0ABU6MH97_9BACI|nr:carbamoyl-phosphate synthase (glutamine-hydrolyzing) large subunit [Heyndrickxia acidicola]MED1204046.1 carbamoyl-phosphate synthase (glutamine-hydrolyzing) large subunit [Heyndrickxia acidicola]
MPYRKEIKKVLVLGSGPVVIGQAAEFDYAGTQACLALKEEGIEVILLNNNPATIMTDKSVADKVYMEPMTVETIERIIQKEKPDGMIGTLGGQTALNLTVELDSLNLLQKYNVELLGTPVDSIQKGEDREKFRQLMIDIQEPVIESEIITSVEAGLAFIKKIGYPVIIRPAYTLGGAGGGFASTDEEFIQALKNGLTASPIKQVLVEKSIKGWKEIEYEVVRDDNDTCIIVCNMENLDPVGVHTGDSIVVAPSQTLSDSQYQLLRNASLKVIRALGIIGGCNIQFALDPYSDQYFIIEVNPRVSRSSALASKATGYPIARVAAKCALGYQLDEIINPITGNTFASFEPALDYIVVKLPRFPFDKFPEADRSLGTQMKATGETMAIDRTFEGALNKALRSIEDKNTGLYHPLAAEKSSKELVKLLEQPTDLRLYAIAEALRKGFTIQDVHRYSQIDCWFLEKINKLIELEKQLSCWTLKNMPENLLIQAKKMNFSDKSISIKLGCQEKQVRDLRKTLKLKPVYKLVDTCAAEFAAVTPYYYSTWGGSDEVNVSAKKKALIIGSGPIRIGQGIEFDYCSVQAVLALKKMGFETIVINNNPETVSTDYSIADKLYFEPLAVEDILNIIEKEKVEWVFTQFGGQTALNVAEELEKEGAPLAGTSVDTIDRLEDRSRFYQLLTKLGIPHIEGEMAWNSDEVNQAAKKLGFPVLVRPSYVIGGQSMHIIYSHEQLEVYLKMYKDTQDARMWPLLVDQYLPGYECELDCVSDGKEIFIPGIFEHIEKAGVHSGDSMAVIPPQHLDSGHQDTLINYTKKISQEAKIVGMANVQFVIHQDEVYVLEVNPRASRTVPIISKITGVPIIEKAIEVQTGNSLLKKGLHQEPDFISVKAPVFSNGKLNDMDPILGPEMKSTGEALALSDSYETALYKALFPKGVNFLQNNMGKKKVVCSISDNQKPEALSLMKSLADKGYKLAATPGTAKFLQQNGVPSETVPTIHMDLKAFFNKETIAAAIILPAKGRDKKTAGHYMRKLSSQAGIPLFTWLDTAAAAYSMPAGIQSEPVPLDEYVRKLEPNRIGG